MYKKKKILALVLARKNSTRLKDKNIINLSGKPLIAWTFDILNKKNIRKLFIDILVSTDSEKIKRISKKYNFLCPWLRPKRLSNKSTTSESSALHALNWYEKKFSNVDGLFLFQPTSPFRSQKKIISAIKYFKKKNNQVVSVCAKKTYKFNTNEVNGSLYLTPTNLLKKYQNFTQNNFIKIKMLKSSENIDIDTNEDLRRAKKFKRKI